MAEKKAENRYMALKIYFQQYIFGAKLFDNFLPKLDTLIYIGMWNFLPLYDLEILLEYSTIKCSVIRSQFLVPL